ncbi:MAG TPA: ABC-type transport auxiliary lipoprotein family protein [Thermoanaerobaculia bacterium]|nr:ABC-type transport auxiliary lipoprotein family protein [Thermoanaerobaculia bacterium]
MTATVTRSRSTPRHRGRGAAATRRRRLELAATAVARAVVVSVVATSLACGSGTPIRYYTFEGPSVERGSESTPDVLRVGVAPIAVAPPYDQDRIAYRPPGSDHEISFYHYHRWALAPSEALQVGLAGALDRLDGIRAEPVSGAASYDAVVAGRVTRFEEVDDTEESIRVVLEISLGLRAGEDEEWRDRVDLALEAPVGSRTVESVVAALAETLDEAARRIATDLLGR